MRVAFFCGCWLSAFCPGFGGDEGDTWQHKRAEYRHKLIPGASLSIANPYGDIRIRAADVDEVLVVAHIQTKAAASGEAGVEFEETTDRLGIVVSFPSDKVGALPASETHRVDIAVVVPVKAALAIMGHKGLIEAKGLKSAVQVETQFGNVTVATEGSVRANCRQGEVRVIFKKTDWSESPVLETVHGDIVVFLPPESNITATAETRGHITSDYSMTVKMPEDKKLKSAQAVIGDGKGAMRLSSTYGDIKLLRH